MPVNFFAISDSVMEIKLKKIIAVLLVMMKSIAIIAVIPLL